MITVEDEQLMCWHFPARNASLLEVGLTWRGIEDFLMLSAIVGCEGQ